jgi:LuxR family maltose regulon positive regulatory protein
LYIPRQRSTQRFVSRPHLVARLNETLNTRLTLISAPAGFGKTTLLSEWIPHSHRCVAWVSLDASDNDPIRFWIYGIAALQQLQPGLGESVLMFLQAPQPPALDLILASLLNELAAFPDEFALVLDDYHLIENPALHDNLAFLLDHLPPNMHLILTSRTDPALPLARLRAHRHLSEIRAADLRFTPDEAAAFLNKVMGLSLSAEDIAALETRTEGWIAGLQLAALSMQGRHDLSNFIRAFTGSHAYIVDYLTEEVLQRQPESVQTFLLQTAILERLSGPLCDTITGQANSQAVLERLQYTNLFIIPLDDERHWYRYHHLFGELLRARLTQTYPDKVPELHRRASDWFERAGLLPEAIQPALAAGAIEQAAAWIETLTPSLLANSGIHQSIESWLAALPEPVVRARPLLCLGHAWLFIHSFDLGPAVAWVEAATQALPANTNGDARRTSGAIAATRAYTAALGRIVAPEYVRTWAEQALDQLEPDDATFRSIASMSLGQAALAQGQTGQAEQAFGEAAAAGQAAGIMHIAVVSTVFRISVLLTRAERRRALAICRTALAWAAEQRGPVARGVGMLSVLLADLLREGNDLEAALPPAIEGLRSLRYFEQKPLILIASFTLARLHLARGEVEDAAAILAEARSLIPPGPYAVLEKLLDASETQVQLALSDKAAIAWASAAEPVALTDFIGFGAHMFAAGVEALGVTAARVLVTYGRTTGDVSLLRQAEQRLEPVWQLEIH